MSIQLSSLTSTQLRRAADLKERIEDLDQELVSILGTSSQSPIKAKGKMSAAGRARISAAQTARWAKVKTKPVSKSVKAPMKKRKMSAAAKAKISAAAKARWAKVRAAGKKSL